MKQLIPVALALSVSTAPAVAQSMVGEVSLPIGSEAPTVVLETLDGEPFDLGSVVGERPVLLEFWATWCENCEALQPQMDAAYEDYGDQVEFIAVAVGVNQNPRRIRRHLERHGTPYTFLWDGRGAAVRAYEAATTSIIVVINAEGVVTYTGVGRDQVIVDAVTSALE